jgi:malate synthase
MAGTEVAAGVELRAPVEGRDEEILSPDALAFVAELHRRFDVTRRELLAARVERQERIDAGELPDFLPQTREIRESDWRVAPVPADLQDRRVEITGPVDRKMVINALNSGARCFMADFEDANAPTWRNNLDGQANLTDAIERTIELDTGEKTYRLGDDPAVLIVRPRGWHLPERHVLVDGAEVSGSLFDFGLYLFHNGRRLLDKGSGPYLYLPKLESHLEARLWNDVFDAAEEELDLPPRTIKATVLIETILAAFEMEEILYELRDHMAGLNAGRWDYIFSIIKKFRENKEFVLPERAQVTMTVPFMRAYTELLVKTSHRRGAHAMGGMAAFVPVAHPDLVPVATEEFDAVLGRRPNQVERLREEVDVAAADLLDVHVPDSGITEGGVRNNVSVGLRYLESWLRGTGAVAIYNLMEDAATAEISRSQVWQWLHHGRIEREQVVAFEDAELAEAGEGRWEEARALFDRVALSQEFEEFLTLPAYELID